MEYRISIIMGIYNCASTLVEALDSLYAQTYQDFKIVLCDDASTDTTYQVASEYAAKKDNIILIRNEKNLKLAATLNRCLDYVDTEYVARMDGDDISLPTRLEKEIRFLDEHPEYALVSCPMIYFDEYGEYRTGVAKEEPTKYDFKFMPPFCHAPVLMRRLILEKVGRYTADVKTERAEDYYLWHKFYRAGFKGYNLQEPLYKMRNGREAFKRRKILDRWKSCKLTIEVNRNLNVDYAWVYGFLSLLKALVPSDLVRFIRTKSWKRLFK